MIYLFINHLWIRKVHQFLSSTSASCLDSLSYFGVSTTCKSKETVFKKAKYFRFAKTQCQKDARAPLTYTMVNWSVLAFWCLLLLILLKWISYKCQIFVFVHLFFLQGFHANLNWFLNCQITCTQFFYRLGTKLMLRKCQK